MAFNEFTRVTTDASFQTTASAGPVTDVAIVDGGDGYMVGDLLTLPGGTADATVTVLAVNPVSYLPNGSGVGEITLVELTSGGTTYNSAVEVVAGATVAGVGDDFVDHTEYETGGDVPEYIEGTGLVFDVTDTVADGVLVKGEIAINDGGTGYITGTQVRIIQTTNDTALLSITAVDAVGTVTDFEVIDGGENYTTATDLVASQVELKTDSPEVYWQGTLRGTFNPTDTPNTTLTENDPRITVTRKADLPQLAIQKRYIDEGVTEVFAEPTLVNGEGDIVGNTLRAEDCVDRPRCEANGFIWVTDTTGDADAGTYGYCREETIAEFKTRTDGTITDFDECVAGTLFDGVDTCDILDDVAATGADLINAAVTGGDIGLEKAMRDCEVSGNFWDVTRSVCVAGGDASITAGAYDMTGDVGTGTPVAGRTGSSNSSRVDFLANACQQVGGVFNYTTYVCTVPVDPATLTTQVLCAGAGYIWIAGSCYNPNDFGDGQNRNATAQQDPNAAPK